MGAKGSSVAMDCVRAKVVRFSGADKPAKKSNREAWRHNELSPLSEQRAREGDSRIRRLPPNAVQEEKPCKSFMVVARDWMFIRRRSARVSASVKPDGSKRRQVRVFGAFTSDLLALADWLKQHGVTHVAMEATGVYWRPVWAVLEGQFEQMLVNPQHIKAVPGRKTDVKDCE